MPIPPPLKSVYRRLGWVEKIFIVLCALYILLLFTASNSGWFILVQILGVFFGIWIAIRLIRIASRRVIWRLRNRLIVTYLFIAMVPVILILTLVGLGAWAVTSQVAVYLVTSELDRRVDGLQRLSENIAKAPGPGRADIMRRMGTDLYSQRFPGIAMVLRTPTGIVRFPEGSVEPPPEKWGNVSGVTLKDGHFFAWAHNQFDGGDFTVLAPLTRDYLSQMVPNLGVVYFSYLRETANARGTHFRVGQRDLQVQPEEPGPRPELPPAVNFFDAEVPWASFVPVAIWDKPPNEDLALLSVRSRLSAIFGVLFSRKSDLLQGLLPVVLLVVSILFLIVELISLVIGITMTRTITRAVHHLYEGTKRVMHGDFAHRIEVKGRDQLADLSTSFNRMTEHLQQLLEVAREKERLQSEIEIAREVQNQLYPKRAPDIRTLRLTAVCKPARMVSGDYFDYESMQDSKVAIAIGDVAGKGISAALLMATLQSSLRTELRGAFELATAAAGAGTRIVDVSTSSLVSHLNEQLYAYTAPEKYATFYLAIYDEVAKHLTYTNAGHLPPILVRDGAGTRLNVDGTVVGAFPFSVYEESRVELHSNDLLVCFTDGITEPENEYGEMFGEDRLVELVTRNSYRSDDQIIEVVLDAVQEWTGSPELQDDMTLLLARRH